MNIRLLITIFFSLNAWLHAAPPSEFLDIPWGARASEAKRILAPRPGLRIKEETGSKILFEGGAFANYPAERYELELPEGRFSRGTVFIVIPPGNGKDGAPLRNHQFEDLYKSLSTKYGKGARTADGKHSESNWIWPATDPRTGQKRTTSIRLSYSWEPYEFIVSYSNLPTIAETPQLKPTKTKDL
ncbi:MAG: hypothetical protein JWL90_1397 [Chthoniobacteraceae bacterium]|nr:hypothetical protein [Chthoniobacteraceae bacterium]